MPPTATATAPTTKPTATNEPLDARVKKAREALDAHVREIVGWHFNPDTGCPFWLGKQTEWNSTCGRRSGPTTT
jgi:hypothetical protein